MNRFGKFFVYTRYTVWIGMLLYASITILNVFNINTTSIKESLIILAILSVVFLILSILFHKEFSADNESLSNEMEIKRIFNSLGNEIQSAIQNNEMANWRLSMKNMSMFDPEKNKVFFVLTKDSDNA